MSHTLETLAQEFATMRARVADGDLSYRFNPADYDGKERQIATDMNAMIEAITAPVNLSAEYVRNMAEGRIPAPMDRSFGPAFDPLVTAIDDFIRMIVARNADFLKLGNAAREGHLQVRADPTKYAGANGKTIAAVNGMLDAVSKPLLAASDCLARISQGDIPPRIVDEFPGDFDVVKQSLNACIDAISLLTADTDGLQRAALEGNLSVRASGDRHRGQYRRIVEGMNGLLDTLLQPLEECRSVLQQLSERDLRARMTGVYRGDHAALQSAVNTTASALHDALTQVSATVDQISTAADQIAVGSQSIAAGASRQASSLEETSSSMEQMASMTRQNADNTRQAEGLATSTRAAADKGARAMVRMLDSMGRIRASAEGTAGIIRDINDIAFQTNLLALNAAVEAARAGDAGRGFAVVAEEVRNLAQRAKEAARKTEELIKESVRLAEGGQGISQEVNGQLTEITDAVGKVATLVGEIAAASSEQTRGFQQVNKALAEMNQVTQQNAANSEESSRAAEALAGQAKELESMVGQFQLARVDRADGRAARGAARPGRATLEMRPRIKPNGKGTRRGGAPLTSDELEAQTSDPELARF